jgi:enoyl-CoA hydratase/carnithine racemase
MDLPTLLLSIQVPTIAAMAGHAIGGGLIMGLWCDIPVLAEESMYGMNFMALGFTPGPGSILGLEDTLGAPLAHELVLTGRLVKGRELKMNGCPLAHAIVPRAEVRTRALSIAQELADIPREALVLLKQVLAERRGRAFREVVKDEVAMQKTLFSSPVTRAEIAERYAVLAPTASQKSD